MTQPGDDPDCWASASLIGPGGAYALPPTKPGPEDVVASSIVMHTTANALITWLQGRTDHFPSQQGRLRWNYAWTHLVPATGQHQLVLAIERVIPNGTHSFSWATFSLIPLGDDRCSVDISLAGPLGAGTVHRLLDEMATLQLPSSELAPTAAPKAPKKARRRPMEQRADWDWKMAKVAEYEGFLSNGLPQEGAARRVKDPHGNPIPRSTLRGWKDRRDRRQQGHESLPD